MTVDEVAEFLGVQVRFVRRLTHERRLPHIKVGRHVRIDPEELSAWLEANRVRAFPARRPA